MNGVWGEPLDQDVEDMARKRSQSLDMAKVTMYVSRLTDARLDRAVFEGILAGLSADETLGLSEVAEIAARYRGGGLKPKSKKAAYEVISKRFLELIRNQAQIAQAKKARPW